jgi:hypothetical protein
MEVCSTVAMFTSLELLWPLTEQARDQNQYISTYQAATMSIYVYIYA